MNSDSIPDVPKLTKDIGYTVWSIRFRFAARAAGVWPVFQGAQVPDNPDRNVVIRMVEKAQAMLVKALENDDVLLVEGLLENPAAALQAVANRHRATSATTLDRLLTMWTNLRMGDTEDILGLANRTRDLA